MATVNAYLNFNGNCEEVFNFYKQVFGGEFVYIGRFKDMPKQDGMPAIPAEMEHLIMHVSLPISKETILMGSDTIGNECGAFVKGNNFSLSINASTRDEADKLFSKLVADNGKVTMPMNTTFWGAYFGMLTDKFGINWMVNVDEIPK